jgi:hypothetical protein
MANLSNKSQTILDMNNKYLTEIGDNVGLVFNVSASTWLGKKAWIIEVSVPKAPGFRAVYKNSSDNHTRLIDDNLLKLLVNDPLRTNDKVSGLVKESLNKFFDKKEMYQKLHSSITSNQTKTTSKLKL